KCRTPLTDNVQVAKGYRRGRLILVDAHSLIYRAFFALPPMSTSGGVVTNAAYGFTSMLAIVLANRPEYAIAAFDVARPTFRSREYAEYKVGRRPMPDDLRPQLDLVRKLLDSLSIPMHGVEGYEADDVIGTLALKANDLGVAVTIVSGDLDCLQLVSDGIEALVPRRGITDTMIYGPDQVRQRYGFEPRQLIEYKALRGDTSDNIPGVPGVGDKTAAQLVQQFGSIENMLDNLDQLKEGRVRTALAANADQIRLGKRMVTIQTDVPVALDLDRAGWLRYDANRARAVFDELEFRQLLARIPAPDAVPIQPRLALEPVESAGAVTLIAEEHLPEAQAAIESAEAVAIFGLWDGQPRRGRRVGFGLGTGERGWDVPARPGGPLGGWGAWLNRWPPGRCSLTTSRRCSWRWLASAQPSTGGCSVPTSPPTCSVPDPGIPAWRTLLASSWACSWSRRTSCSEPAGMPGGRPSARPPRARSLRADGRRPSFTSTPDWQPRCETSAWTTCSTRSSCRWRRFWPRWSRTGSRSTCPICETCRRSSVPS